MGSVRLRWIVASTVALASACSGGDDAVVRDAGDPDAMQPSPDAPDPDPSTVVTVRTRDRTDAPIAGVIVFGHDAAGALVDQTLTDAAGRAFVHAPAGGSITTHEVNPVVPPEVATHHWYTVLDVAPGDDIFVHVERGNDLTRQTSVAAPALPAGATLMYARAPCGGSSGASTTQTMLTNPGCPSHGMVLLAAEDNQGTPLGYIAISNADLTQPVIAAGPWLAPTQTFTFDATGFPANGGRLSVSRGTLADGYAVHWTSAPVNTSTSTASVTRSRPDAGDSVVYQISQGNGGFCDYQIQQVTRSNAAEISQLSFDVSQMLAPVTGVQFGDHQISWTGGGGGQGVLVGFSAAQSSGDVISSERREWRLVAPAGTNTVVYPHGTGFVWPVAVQEGNRFTSAYVRETVSTRWTSYAELRQHHDEDSPQIDGDFTMRSTSITRQYAYAGCPFVP